MKFPVETNEVEITISVTEKCNLLCEYCYQESWNKEESIGKKELKTKVLNYISAILPKIEQPNSVISIHFIGGEPLLEQEVILEIVDEIQNINANVNIRYYIDTNLSYITVDFLKHFPNLAINTTLTLKEDHDRLRSNSYDRVVEKLELLKDYFDGEQYKICIRYNLHHDNIDDLEKLIIILEDMNLNFFMDVQNIQNSQKCCFVNKISNDDFEKIYLDKIVPILVKHSLCPELLMEFGLSRHCLGENILNCKFYSNGKMALCDAISKDKALDYVERIKPLPEMCILCEDFPYCGGPKPCDIRKCNGYFERKDIVHNRIKKYVELFLQE